MEPDTLAVIAVIALLAVAALILGLLLNARRDAALREQGDKPAARSSRAGDPQGSEGRPRR